MAKNNDNDDDDLIEVGFQMGLCPEYEEKDLLNCMDFIHSSIKYILVLETTKGHEYPYNRVICKGKYLIEAFDDDENTVDLDIKKGLVKKFITYIEKNIEKHKILFAFSKEIAKEDFTDVITTGILISRVAIEGNLPGIASKMAFIALTAP
jgi:hypothetical protein